MSGNKIIEKLESYIKEELWGRINPKDVTINRFRTMDEFYNTAASEASENEVAVKCREHLENYSSSVISMYMLGLFSFNKGSIEKKSYLVELLNIYVNAQKWGVVEHIAERILEFSENRVALRALALALEKLKRVKDAVPIWEELIKINRYDAEVAKKLAAALSDEKPRSVSFLKLALEGYIREGNFTEAGELLEKILETSGDELAYFEKIERLLFDAQQKDLAVSMMKKLYDNFKDNDDVSIDLLKRILKYDRDDFDARKKIVAHFQKKYAGHSQLDQFMEISRLNDFRTPIKNAVELFENNIVFDTGNYVYHRTWGLGLIQEISRTDILIDFKGKPGHKMSVQMALQSLTPVSKEHFYVREFEHPEEIRTLFDDNIAEFMRLLVRSHGRKTSVLAIKKDIVPSYVEEKSWTRWWNKVRGILKKEADFAFNDQKKDELGLREKPVTYFEDLIGRFGTATSFSPRLDAAIDLINNVDPKEATDSADMFIESFVASAQEGSNTKLILSYFILSSFEKYFNRKIDALASIKKDVTAFIAQSKELQSISRKITSYDYKKDFVNLIQETRSDWMNIHCEILFETPIRIHKYIFNNLIREHGYNNINNFIDRVIVGSREFPEIFLWIARNILTGSWSYDWLDYSRKGIILSLFRLLYELKKIDSRNPRVKNMLLELIFGFEYTVLRKLITESDLPLCAKIYDMANNSGYADQWQMEKFLQIAKEIHQGFVPQSGEREGDSADYDEEDILVLKSGYDRKAEELNVMVNNELVQLTKELSEVSDLSGDIRENVDYSALLEKQSILKKSISKLEEEIKKAKIIDLSKISPESVVPGTTVSLEKIDLKETVSYSILGPWDADFDRNILSYRSGMARALLKHRIGEEVEVVSGENVQKFRIVSIAPFSN